MLSLSISLCVSSSASPPSHLSPFLCIPLPASPSLHASLYLSILLTRGRPLWDPVSRPRSLYEMDIPAVPRAGAQPAGWSVASAVGLSPLPKGHL